MTTSTNSTNPRLRHGKPPIQPTPRPVQSKKGTYRLQRHVWRSFLTLVGPLILLAYYSFIACEFLASPPANGIVPQARVDARWIYYIWFIIAIFVLEWARAGLANIEAAALMYPQLAPRTAAGLMWHTDMKWSNPLWWLRASRFVPQWVNAFWRSLMQCLRRNRFYEPEIIKGPTILWLLLSFNTFLLLIAIPLSGITMELSAVSAFTRDPVLIYGPNSTTFNARGPGRITSQSLSLWQSGRPATPPYSALLYAPQGTTNVSATYFDDLALESAPTIQFFAGPTVKVPVVGKAWGMHANISCLPVRAENLQMLQIHDVNNYSVKVCDRNDDEMTCTPQWKNPNDWWEQGRAAFSFWLTNNVLTSGSFFNFSFVVVADGWYQDDLGSRNPYVYNASHDNLTFDHMRPERHPDDTTTAIFEMFIWQATYEASEVPPGLANGSYGPVEVLHRRLFDTDTSDSIFYGVGVHCGVETAVGSAQVDPAHRTFASFEKGNAPEAIRDDEGNLLPYDPNDLDHSIGSTPPVQVQAVHTLVASNDSQHLLLDTFESLHLAANSPFQRPTASDLVLTPADLQLAVYRLLGNTVVAMMDEGGYGSWFGELYSLAPTRYLTQGVLSYIYVLVLLALWTFSMSAAAAWVLLLAGPRWASSLSGFEMFKFGAEYPTYVHEFAASNFEDCSESLGKIPGMVGILPGEPVGQSSNPEKFGFIGLSESVAERRATYTMDRRQASMTRFAL